MPKRRDFLKMSGIAASVGLINTNRVQARSASTKAAPEVPVSDTVGAATNKQPNILLILVDDLGYGDLSSYGAKDLKTPNIDKLMSSGKRFDHFYANCPVCSPTRASIMSGRYPDLVGVPGVIRTHRNNNWGFLNPEAVMLPTMLKKAGYSTSIIGKWHLGLKSPNTPTERGFDHFHGFLGDMMDDYYHHRRHGNHYMRLNGQDVYPEGHATDIFTNWAIDHIKKEAKSDHPFFMYLAYNAPHTPIQPPEDWLSRVKKREAGINEKRARLVALIEHLDDGIGRVIRALDDAGVAENTLVVFTSDNGGQVNVEGNNGNLNGGKQNMFEGGIRVPMCAVWPGIIEAGSRSNQVAMTMDLFPTFCEAAGIDVPHEIEARSILSTFKGKIQDFSDRMLFWVRREGHRYGGRAYYAARFKQYKLLQNTPFETMRLYDLENDPGEKNPLDEAHPMYKKLWNALAKHINLSGGKPWQE